MKSLQVKIPYIILQGVFLPLLWLLDTFYDSGQTLLAWIVFATYELLVIVDAIMYWVIFERSKER